MNLHQTDPEFMERYERFAGDEVVHEPGQTLDARTRHMAILATLLGCQGIDEFREALPRALDEGITPVEVKEIVYQSVDYLGMGRVRPFLTAANDVLAARGVELPLPGQATTSMDDRLEKGAQAQAEIFGPQMLEAWKQPHQPLAGGELLWRLLPRTGLTLAQREMITFCFLMAQGGCEPQLTAHARGNMNLGNDAAFLTRVVSQCLPLHRLSAQSQRPRLHWKGISAIKYQRRNHYVREYGLCTAVSSGKSERRLCAVLQRQQLPSAPRARGRQRDL